MFPRFVSTVLFKKNQAGDRYRVSCRRKAGAAACRLRCIVLFCKVNNMKRLSVFNRKRTGRVFMIIRVLLFLIWGGYFVTGNVRF